MEPIKYYIMTRRLFYNDLEIASTVINEYEEMKRVFLKYARNYPELEKLTDEELMTGFSIEQIPAANTWPKFNNEKPFAITWNLKKIKNPQIIAVQWTGEEWQYKLKNIGHEYDFQPEKYLYAL